MKHLFTHPHSFQGDGRAMLFNRQFALLLFCLFGGWAWSYEWTLPGDTKVEATVTACREDAIDLLDSEGKSHELKLSDMAIVDQRHLVAIPEFREHFRSVPIRSPFQIQAFDYVLYPCGLIFSPNDRRLIVGTANGLEVYDTRDWSKRFESDPSSSITSPSCLSFSQGDVLHASSYASDQHFQFRLLGDGTLHTMLACEFEFNRARQIVALPDRRHVVFAPTDSTKLILFNAESAQQVQEIKGIVNDPIEYLHVNPAGTQAVVFTQKFATLVDLSKAAPIQRMKIPVKSFRNPAISEDGSTCYVVTSDSKADITGWNLQTGEPRTPCDTHRYVYFNREYISLSPDGGLLATTIFDFVEIWDTRSGKMITSIHRGEFQNSCRAAFSHDNKLMAVPENATKKILVIDIEAARNADSSGLPQD